MAYANQEIIVRVDDVEKGPGNPFQKLSVECVQEAMKELKGYEFALYILLYMNALGFELEFSPSALEQMYGGTRKTWGKARDVLKEKGYLVPIGGPRWKFLEKPVREEKDWDF